MGLNAELARDVLALVEENERLRETLRVREASQIPMIPTGAARKLDALLEENKRLRRLYDAALVLDDQDSGTLDEFRAALAALVVEGDE